MGFFLLLFFFFVFCFLFLFFLVMFSFMFSFRLPSFLLLFISCLSIFFSLFDLLLFLRPLPLRSYFYSAPCALQVLPNTARAICRILTIPNSHFCSLSVMSVLLCLRLCNEKRLDALLSAPLKTVFCFS